jgi:cell division protein ZapA
MPVVNIKIRENTYPIACADGEEKHLQFIASKLDQRVNTLAEKLGKANSMQLLIMAALMMEDQLNESGKTPKVVVDTSHTDKAVSETIEAIADYIETLAKNLERA